MELSPWGLSGKNLLGFLSALGLLRRNVTQSGKIVHLPSHKWTGFLVVLVGFVLFGVFLWKFLVCYISQLCLVQFGIVKFCKTRQNSLPAFPSASESISWPNVLTNDAPYQFPSSSSFPPLSPPPAKKQLFDSLSLEPRKHNRGDR